MAFLFRRDIVRRRCWLAFTTSFPMRGLAEHHRPAVLRHSSSCQIQTLRRCNEHPSNGAAESANVLCGTEARIERSSLTSYSPPASPRAALREHTWKASTAQIAVGHSRPDNSRATNLHAEPTAPQSRHDKCCYSAIRLVRASSPHTSLCIPSCVLQACLPGRSTTRSFTCLYPSFQANTNSHYRSPAFTDRGSYTKLRCIRASATTDPTPARMVLNPFGRGTRPDADGDGPMLQSSTKVSMPELGRHGLV